MLDGKETAVVWFNGPSARDLHHIPRQQLEIGCNFIEQHRVVDHVCCYDLPVMRELTQRGANEGVSYWTRRRFGTKMFQTFDSGIRYRQFQNVNGFCSGTLALALAHHLGVRSVFLLGMDWQITNESLYDDRYTWRAFQPNKTSRSKWDFLEVASRVMEITVVHDQPREFAGDLGWMDVAAFRDGVGST